MAIQKVLLTTRLILEQDGKFLYLEQTPQNGAAFTLPGGKVEEIEFARQALARETAEEIGVAVKKKDMALIHVIYKKLKNSTEIIFFFKTTHWKGEPIVLEPEKFAAAVWFPIFSPPKKMPVILKYALKRIHSGKTYSEYPKVLKPKKKTKRKPKEESKTPIPKSTRTNL